MRPSRYWLAGVLLVVVATGCSDEQPFELDRSVRFELEAAGLPEGAAAEYRIFVQDTAAIAHGVVANGETDTVRVSSSAALNVRWQEVRATVGDVDYVFAPAEREVVIEESDTDTTVALLGSYALASGGFSLTAPGLPEGATAYWQAWSEDESLLDGGRFIVGETIRRGDLPPGHVRLELDTALLEVDGVRHAYTPPQHVIPLNISASLELLPLDAPYAVASVVVRMSASGLPAGTLASWGINRITGDYALAGYTIAGTVQTADLIEPGSYTVVWHEVTLNGVRYRPNPASQPATLEPRIEPYEFEALYAPTP